MQNALAFLQLLINYQSFSYLRLTYVETCQDKAVNYYHLNDIDTYFFLVQRIEMKCEARLIDSFDVHISMVGNSLTTRCTNDVFIPTKNFSSGLLPNRSIFETAI